MKNNISILVLFLLTQNLAYSQFLYDAVNSSFIARWYEGRCLTNESVGNYTFIGDGEYFKFLDISNPTIPVCTDSLKTPGVVQKIVILDTIAYIADGVGGLRIIDISNINAIHELGSYNTSGYTNSVSILGDYAYLADGRGGFV